MTLIVATTIVRGNKAACEPSREMARPSVVVVSSKERQPVVGVEGLAFSEPLNDQSLLLAPQAPACGHSACATTFEHPEVVPFSLKVKI
jgi:hypothetical protein